MLLQSAGEVLASELAALVGIEDLGPGIAGKRLLERLDTKIGAERVGQPPRQHRPAHPVHDDHQVKETLSHRDVGDVREPDLINPLDREPAEEVRIAFVRRRLAGVRALVGARQTR